MNFRRLFDLKYQFCLLKTYVSAYKLNIQSHSKLNAYIYFSVALAALSPHVALI
jgi:hypothetical protein